MLTFCGKDGVTLPGSGMGMLPGQPGMLVLPNPVGMAPLSRERPAPAANSTVG